MKNNPYNKPLFLGLSHIGQVYSIAWAKKVGQCSAFDFEKKIYKQTLLPLTDEGETIIFKNRFY